MAHQGLKAPKFKNCNFPKCAACLFGRAKQHLWRHKPTWMNPQNKDTKEPGKRVSVDQITLLTPGFIQQMVGRLTSKRYTCATIFVDNATIFGYVWLQTSLSATKTLQGKEAFEREARDAGIEIKQYRANNGIFKSKQWVTDCIRRQQKQSFCAANAHHQNGHAES